MRKATFLLLLLGSFIGCKNTQYAPYQYKSAMLTPSLEVAKRDSNAVNQWLNPYRSQLSAALDSQLFISCRTESKKQPNSAIGSHLTEVMTAYAKEELNTKVDAAMLNYGGIRASLPKGEVRIRHIFEIMPFDNALCVIEMDSIQMLSFAQYWISAKGHPIHGFKVALDSQNRPYIIWNDKTTRYPVKMVVTDYVANGGDNATFFKQIKARQCLKTPLRDALIQYYRTHLQARDTLCLPQE